MWTSTIRNATFLFITNKYFTDSFKTNANYIPKNIHFIIATQHGIKMTLDRLERARNYHCHKTLYQLLRIKYLSYAKERYEHKHIDGEL